MISPSTPLISLSLLSLAIPLSPSLNLCSISSAPFLGHTLSLKFNSPFSSFHPHNDHRISNSLSSSYPSLHRHYSIKFHPPPPLPSTSPPISSPPPLIVVLGWLGARSHNLSKYSSLYSSHFHLPTLSIMPSVISPFLPTGVMRYLYGKTVVEKMSQHMEKYPQSSIMVHCMSNLGAYHYAAIIQYLQQYNVKSDSPTAAPHPLLSSIHSVIFDSSPSHLSLSILQRGYNGFISGKLFHHPIYDKRELEEMREKEGGNIGLGLRIKINIFEGISSVLSGIFVKMISFSWFQKRLSDLENILYLKKSDSPSPSPSFVYYLYSQKDHLIPPEHVREFAEVTLQSMKEREANNNKNDSVPTSTPSPSPSIVHLTQTDILNSSLSDFTSPTGKYHHRVLTCDFVDSLHVENFRKYPKEYSMIVQSAIENVKNMKNRKT